jgi:hypothetical protein
MLLEPKSVEFENPDGTKSSYILSKFPAVAGREIVVKYPLSGMPKLGDYAVNEETMLKLMAYVAVDTPNGPIQLSTRALVDNHVKSWETLGRIEIAMMEYNCSFFANGRVSTFFEGIAQKLPTWIQKTLTDSLRQLSERTKQPSKN